MSWIKILKTYVDAVSEIEDYRPMTEYVLEEDVIVPTGRRVPKKLPRAMEEKEVKDVKLGADRAPLKYFMDGVQRTILIGHILSKSYGALLPLQLHLSGVVIIDDRSKVVYGPETQVKLIVPKKDFLPQAVLDELDETVVETKDMGRPSYDYATLRKRGYEKSSHLRDELEQKALRNFRKTDGYLLYDGAIPNIDEFMQRKEIIGLIKTHMTRFLELRDEPKVFTMPAGHRSWLFEIRRRDLLHNKEYPIHSCYLRLRKLGRDPLAGLVRVEVNPSATKEIDEICLSIFDERLPVQINTSNWDRKIYPIYRCERIISAHLPSRETLHGLFKGVSR